MVKFEVVKTTLMGGQLYKTEVLLTNLDERLHVLLTALRTRGATVHSIIETHIRWHTQAVSWDTKVVNVYFRKKKKQYLS